MKLEILNVWFTPSRGDKQMQSRRWGLIIEGTEKLERIRSLMDSKAKKLGGMVHFLYRERPDLSAENAD